MEAKEMLFSAGENGYHAYRIPVVTITDNNTVLAFTEARKNSSDDYATIDLIMKRKPKDGVFSNGIIISPKENENSTYHNLCVIVDGKEIHLIYCKDYLEIFHMVSGDDGKTFSNPEEISYAVRDKECLMPYTAVASGPSGGIVTKKGRYLVPCWIAKGSEHTPHDNANVFVLYSDDKGKTWAATQKLTPDKLNASECAIVNLPDGNVMLNFRHTDPCHIRGYIVSKEGITWSEPIFDEELNEQVCMAGFTETIYEDKPYYLFLNPDYRESYIFFHDRKKLTLKISEDGCNHWKNVSVLEEGFSGYSDVAAKDGKVVMLYEQAISGNPYSLIYAEEELKNYLKEIK